MIPYVYTVVGGHPASFRCAELLRQSLDERNAGGYEWAVHQAPPDLRPYAGVYKLMVALPPGRDCYLYLDADVLFLDDLQVACEAVGSGAADLAVAHESRPMSHVWFRYPHASAIHVEQMRRVRGINGGSFAFRDRRFLSRAYDLFRSATRRPAVPGDVAKSAALEQSALNYAWLTGEYPTATFEVAFSPELAIQSTGIFHFVGGAGEMGRKLRRMERFMEVRRHGKKDSETSDKETDSQTPPSKTDSQTPPSKTGHPS